MTSTTSTRTTATTAPLFERAGWVPTTDRDGRGAYAHRDGYLIVRTGPRQWTALSADGREYADTATFTHARDLCHEWETYAAPVAASAPAVAVVSDAVPMPDADDRPALPATLADTRAALAAARAARGDRRPVDRPRGYVPTPDPAGLAVDWTTALYGTALERYAAVSDLLLTIDPDDDTAAVAHPDAASTHVDGVTPNRAILAGDWTDGHGQDAASDRAHEIARWALRQPADAVAVLPMRSIVGEAADAVAREGDDATRALLSAVREGTVQAASSGRVMAARVADVLGMGESDRNGRRLASALTDRVLDTVAARALAALDTAENGEAVHRVVWQTVRPVVTRHGAGIVTGARVVAIAPALDRDVLGISYTVDKKTRRAMWEGAAAGRVWTADREDGTTWSASDAGQYRHVTRVSPVATDENGYPAALGYSLVTRTVDPSRVRQWQATGTPEEVADALAGVVDVVTPTRAQVVRTARPDLTRAALADDMARIRGDKRRTARPAADTATEAPATVAPSARDLLRARAGMRR